MYELKRIYSNKNDSSGWTFENASNDLKNNETYYTKILYRPFDIRHTVYTGKSGGFIGRPRTSTMFHLVEKNNLGLVTLRINGEGLEYVCLITNHVIEKGSLPKGNYSVFPLYVYHEKKQAEFGESGEREPNLNMEIVQKIADGLGLQFTKEKEDTEGTFAPIDLLDYIYAVLHSPSYRDKYKEFLKIDFPRIPYPEDVETFWKLVSKGGELRQIHLMESPILENHEYYFPVEGSNEVDKTEYKGGRVYINKEQYFENVPEISWNFYIGGYQPAQKWLKDRKGRVLTFDDIQHYQKIIKALLETDKIMKEIDSL